MKVCFVLPQMLKKPVGGYKMVYQYANGLCLKGHEVYILYLNEKALQRFPMPSFLRKIAIHYFTQIEPKWFSLDKDIKKLSSLDNNEQVLNKMEIAIATGADTIYRTMDMFRNARKYYFIQGYETWLFSEEDLFKTYMLDARNIVIAKWLKDIVDRYSKKPAYLLKNPIDTNKYKVKNKIELRQQYSVGILYHDSESKGFKYAYEAICMVKKLYPELKLYMFGTSVPDFEIPGWVDYTLNATQEQTIDIYNKVSIFVCGSIIEGFGLTGLEAMACGATLVSTDYDGVREYAINEYNALLSPVKDPESLKNNIVRLLNDDNLRKIIAFNGTNTAIDFSLENAIDQLNMIINDC